MEDCLELLHFHLGSQITNIRQIKAAVIEGARVYVDIKRLGTGLKYMDVGGGLGSRLRRLADGLLNPASTTRLKNMRATWLPYPEHL